MGDGIDPVVLNGIISSLFALASEGDVFRPREPIIGAQPIEANEEEISA